MLKRPTRKADLIGTYQMAGWESYVFTSLLGSAFLLVDDAFSPFFSVLRSSLRQLSLDLIALRIFSLQVEYTISSESKEIRTLCQKWFYIKN